MPAKAKVRLPLSGLKILLITFFAVTVFLPLFRMLAKMADVDIVKIVSSSRFLKAMLNSLSISAVAMLLSVGLAMVLAWCVVRSGIRMKSLWTLLFTLPMLIPSISHGMGLIVLFGSNGVLTRFFHINGDIYGFWGVVIGSVMYSFPVAFLMIADVLKYEDSSPYEAAAVLGLSKPRQVLAITFPYLRRPMIAVFFSVFTMIVTDYGVPLIIGTGDTITLPVMMYQDVIEGMDFGKGSVIGLVLLFPALAAFIIDLLNRDGGNTGYVLKPFDIKKNRKRDTLAYIFCSLVVVFVLLPVASFVVLTFVQKYPINLSLTLQHITRALDMNAGDYLGNSLMIALLVAVVGVLISCVVAYLTARTKSKTARMLHLISIMSLAVPGLVLGLSYALFFKGSFLYNTLTILVMVNLVHFFASPYLMMYNAFGKLNENLELVGETLGIGRIRMICNVLIPQAKTTILEMFAYFFVNSMMTISAVSFLATASTKPIALMIPNFENTMMRESMAFISLVILAVNLLVRTFFNFYKRLSERRAG